MPSNLYAQWLKPLLAKSFWLDEHPIVSMLNNALDINVYINIQVNAKSSK